MINKAFKFRLIFELIIFLSFSLLLLSCEKELKKKSSSQKERGIEVSKGVKELLSDTSKVNPTIDSLKGSIFTETQTNQILILGELAENWRMYTYLLANEELNQAKTYNYDYGIGDAFCKLGLYYVRNFNYDSAAYYLNEAEELGDKINSDKLIAQSLSWQAELYRVSGQNENAIQIQNKAINYASKSKDIKRLAFSYISKGEAHRILGDFEDAISCYEKSILNSEKINDENKISICYNSLGDVYRILNNFPKALEYYNKGLDLAKKNNNKNQLAFCLSGIGDVYVAQFNEAKKSIPYFQQALQISKQANLKTQLCNTYSSLGLAYNILKQNEKALECFTEAIKLAEQIGYYDKAAFCYSVIGEIFNNSNQNEKAFDSFNKAIAIAQETGNKGLLASTYYLIADLKFKMKSIEEAEKYATMSLKLSYENKILNAIKDNATLLTDVYTEKKDYKNALRMMTLHIAMKDSVNNEENIKRMASIEYEAKAKALKAEQDMKDAMYKADKEKKETELNRQKTIRYAFTVGFILVLILVVVVFRNLQENKKKNKIITQQKEEVEIQKELVEEKNKEITDSITYAKRLQEAILPPLKFVQQEFNESFIIYQPKDIVAGDFYWMEKIDSTIFIAAADSTGHGVPGALVSVVCSNALNRAIKEFKLRLPGEILDKTRELVLETFEKSEGEVKDGMDISLIVLEKNESGEITQIHWSGANNPLYFINEKGLGEIKADKQPIGKSENIKKFITHKLVVEKGTIFYLITDGYADQFGGPNGKKFKSKNLQQLFIENRTTNLAKQGELFTRVMANWKGELEQVDDITMIGFKI